MPSPLEIRRARNGQGSFALARIRAGETIRQLTGVRHDRFEMRERIARKEISPDDPLLIDDVTVLELDEPSRLINHSCEPNGGVRGEAELVALRDIEVGEEITYDYGAVTSPDSPWSMTCNCGAARCRGVVSNVSAIPKEIVERYRRADGLQRYILRWVEQT